MKTRFLIWLIFLVGFLILFCGRLYAENIDPDNDGSQYAYGANVGWLNLEPNQGPGVTVSTTRLTGYVWVANIGWVSLSCSNTGSCGTVNYGVVNDGAGNLSGYAWSANAGWISFSCENTGTCGSVDYGVTIDGSGVFDGWAYGQNIGWIHFQSASPVPYKVKARVIGLLLLTPNGGQQLFDGSVYQITWQTTGVISNVVVEYSTDNGQHWTLVNPANSGNADLYNWIVPATPSTQCLVRISDLSEPDVLDTSNSVFSIMPPRITILTPNGGEQVPIDAYYQVTWQTQGTVANVDIWYSTNNGVDWVLVVPGNTGNTGNYNWFVPHVTSNQGLVYAANAADANIHDTSNAVFSMTKEISGPSGGWGKNDYGQSNPPAGKYSAFSGGEDFSLGLRPDGSIVGWGDDSNGQCDVPSSNTGFIAIAAGGYHSLGLKQDGSIVAWGRNNIGQCNVPEPNTGFTAIAAGHSHSLGLKQDGSVVAWGRNDFGQCNVPSSNTGFIAIAAGGYHSLGLKQDGSIVAWGQNIFGQCTVPLPNTDFMAIAAGGYRSLGLKTDGSIVVWGSNQYGEGVAPTGNHFTAISAGNFHNLAIYECSAVLTGDLNGDCRVDFKDFAIFASQWLQCGDPFDQNCVP